LSAGGREREGREREKKREREREREREKVRSAHMLPLTWQKLKCLYHHKIFVNGLQNFPGQGGDRYGLNS
jgi:hypothetical protein